MVGYPIIYGDNTSEKKMLSEYIVDAAKNERVQKYLGSVASALFTLSLYSQAASAIPPEYGQAANEMIHQVGQNGAAAVGIPVMPPIGLSVPGFPHSTHGPSLNRRCARPCFARFDAASPFQNG